MERLDLAIDCRLRASTGIGRYLRELVPRIAALEPGWRLLLVGPDDNDPWVQANFPRGVVCLPSTARVFRRGEQQLFREVMPRARALWCPHFAVPWRLAAGTRLVVTIHDLIPLHVVRGWKGWVRRWGAEYFLRAARRQATRVLTPSRAVAGQLEREMNFAPDRLRPIALGVSAEWFEPPAKAAAPASEPPRVLYVGNISAHKNVEGLLSAFLEVTPALPHRLTIVGEERGFTGQARLGALVKALGPRVTFVRGLSDRDLRELYRSSALLVLPSREEGFGLPPLEAMAVGCPVLTSDCAALLETAGPGAHHFSLGTAGDLSVQLGRLLGDPLRRTSRVDAGREWARGFTWERTAKLTSDVLREGLS